MLLLLWGGGFVPPPPPQAPNAPAVLLCCSDREHSWRNRACPVLGTRRARKVGGHSTRAGGKKRQREEHAGSLKPTSLSFVCVRPARSSICVGWSARSTLVVVAGAERDDVERRRTRKGRREGEQEGAEERERGRRGLPGKLQLPRNAPQKQPSSIPRPNHAHRSASKTPAQPASVSK